MVRFIHLERRFDGYRAISFRRGETLFLSFVGDHDECQKYLDHYSGRHNWVAKENGTSLPVQMAELADGRRPRLWMRNLTKNMMISCWTR